MVPALVVGALVAVLGIALVLIYNRLVRLRNRTEQGWAQIDVQLQRRHDLIPNLVETVNAYAAHERRTLEQVVAARDAAAAAAAASAGAGETADAEAGLSAALSRLFALAEDYPDLEADRSFRQLQTELAATEDRVAYARRYYNDAVQSYDTALEQFPGVLVAGPFGFVPADYFQAEGDPVRAVPRVDL